MPLLDRWKKQVQRQVDAHRDRLLAISDSIHAEPELGLREHRAAELLTTTMAAFGFRVERPVAGLDTAFVATFKGREKGPRLAFLAEYDAVPGLGHACGHNVIAAAAVGAALSLKEAVSELGGTVAVYGTPDEEAVDVSSRGGKVIMAEAGLFDDVDAALMVHATGGANSVWQYSFPLKDFGVRFLGKPAHYTVPHEGINALESLLLFINAANTMKRGWTPEVMFAYTITDGGGPSAIVVPESAEAHVTMKAFSAAYLEALYRKVEACAAGVAAMTGARLEMQVLGQYRNTIPNLQLCLSLYRNLRALGSEVESPVVSQRALEKLTYPGPSTDFGDVSWVTAGIHGYCSIGGDDLVAHTREFAAAAGSAAGHRAVILSAKALAMTAVDLLADPGFARKVKGEFQRYREEGFVKVPGIPPGYPPLPEEFLRELGAAERGRARTQRRGRAGR
jgi:amidohydrolase